ncbi:TetR/AcrR family transcriptional regulator [Nocardiopsis aegyptia]|uniref:AcrR family transcriptional regulator n=1 Tax=Nocardiopsis aegyptia TaxID=220378 RepID=A0A7Z0ERR0_9ACTN|nr:TetR/AcrR family transcriptional regulator [Nocardiopsis aegyptia]NYJ37028.1 AcrR family transcriptional regulator [Nocardiopsis aegyptia]
MSGGRGGRRPDPTVDAAILAAAVELLAERGFDLTFDEVAARAGVGRTSVFRRYATKQDLVLAAAEQVTIERIDVPDTGSLRGDLGTAVARVYSVFGRDDVQPLARHALAAAYQGSEGGTLLRSVLGRRSDLVTEVLERAVARGEIPDSGRALLVADLLSGVIMARLATGVPLPEGEEADRVADALVAAAGG